MDTLECPVCYEQLLLGVTNRCGHRFCFSCFLGVAATTGHMHGQMDRCPMCRAQAISNTWTSDHTDSEIFVGDLRRLPPDQLNLALRFACMMGNLEASTILIEMGADINGSSRQEELNCCVRNTPLVCSFFSHTYSQDTRLTRYLLEQLAQIHPTHSTDSLLYAICFKKHLAVPLLLEHQADIQRCEYLDIACDHFRPKVPEITILQCLIDAGARGNRRRCEEYLLRLTME